jgi:HK97 gp10 family phage protein
MAFTVEVKGLSEMQRMLSQLPGVLQEKIGVDAMAKAAQVIQAEVTTRAPVRASSGHEDGKKVSRRQHRRRYPGNLKQNIHVRRVQAESGSMISFEVGPSGAAWYGRLVELGTSRAAAHPFLRPAVDAKAQDSIDTFAHVLEEDLETAVRQAS